MALYPPKEIVEKSERFDPDNPDFSMGCFNRMIACPLEWYMDRLSQEIFREDGVDTMAGLASAHQKDVYVYLFGWNDEPEPFNDLLGAAHALDLAFWFGNFDRGRDSLFGMAWSRANEAQRLELSDNMMSYLQHFVASGNPNSSGHPEWLPWTGGKGNQKRMFFSAGKVSRVSGLDA
jgi:carboxylesterase type B